jgi:hypothetical protein
MTLPDLQLGQPLTFQHLTILPVVRQNMVCTPEFVSGAVSPVAVVILDGHDVRLCILDERIPGHELVKWLAESGERELENRGITIRF